MTLWHIATLLILVPLCIALLDAADALPAWLDPRIGRAANEILGLGFLLGLVLIVGLVILEIAP